MNRAGLAVGSFAGLDFEQYVRVVNPAIAGAHTADERRRSWRSLVEPAQTFDGSTAQWAEVRASMSDATAVGEPAMGQVELTTARALVEVLSRHTSTPAECLFAWWIGYADVRMPAEAPRVSLPPAREMFVMEGGVSEGAHEHAVWGIARTPMRWVPRDRAWSVGNDIYGRSVFIGGTGAAMTELLEHPDLEVYVVDAETTVMAEDW
ncbi:hypothetical protein B7R21_07640 [Subtercola boreus]|uniref:Uncharacterized protein n=2 Tax=Subtercola boreus TaxID=120213 RepID=A0A3E0VUU4_9MICO|nr:hypothetical protein B7R21_07640 [Subtercola boreus]